MKQLAMCCGQPPLIFTGHDVTLKPVYSCACLTCGRVEVSRDKEYCVSKFNKGVKGDAKQCQSVNTVLADFRLKKKAETNDFANGLSVLRPGSAIASNGHGKRRA